MSSATIAEHSRARVVTSGRCRECDYDLHGLPPAHPCPECGHVNDAATSIVAPDLAWRRAVTAGLVLLLGVALHAASCVLIQPFTNELGGSLGALNLPGPKLWVVPLIQRPIGRSPEWWGVAGTRAALVSLVALWLITARRPGEGHTGEPLRLATRWGSVALFGLAFGAMVGSQQLWPPELPPYRLALVGGAELPACALLYAYLHTLAHAVPGRVRRGLFGRLRWAVPATVAGGVALLGFSWVGRSSGWSRAPDAAFGIAALYGVLAVSCAVAATSAVGGLACAFGVTAFPSAREAVAGMSRRARGTAQWMSAADPRRARFACAAVGLVLLCLAAVAGNEQILRYTWRVGLSGNLPFFNFPGPKIWAAAAVPEMRSGYALVSPTALVALNLAAVWMATVRLNGRENVTLRLTTRWLPIVGMGAALGCAVAWRALWPRGGGYLDGTHRSEFFAYVTLVCEVPPTLALYAYLAHLARLHAPGTWLRVRLLAVGAAAPALVGASVLAMALSRGLRGSYAQPLVVALGGLFGVFAVAAAASAAAAVLSLAAALVTRAPPRAPASRADQRRNASDLPRDHPRARAGLNAATSSAGA